MIAAAKWLRATKLLVSHGQLAEAIDPTVAYLDHPTTRLLRRVASLGISVFAAADDMRDVAGRLDDLQGTAASIAGVGAQVLAATHARGLALDHDCPQYRVELRDVMLIRSGHDERQRDATAVH